MKVLTTSTFDRTSKKLYRNQKKALDSAIDAILNNPKIGEAKKGDLAGVLIYKFKILDNQYLLAYELISRNAIKLLTIGVHENFYKDLKRK